MNTFPAEYANNQAVAVGTPVTGKKVAMGLQKANCFALYTTYTLGTAGNTISLQLQCQDPVNLNWVNFGTPLALSAAGGAINTLTVPAGTTAWRLVFTSTGTGTDIIEVVVTGLPQGYTIS